jgi:hypothetical protein
MIGLDDLVIGFVLSKLFGSATSGPAKSPAVVFPPGGGAPPTAQQPTPSSALPSFPVQVSVPATPTDAPAGFKRAIEVWQVVPSIAKQAAPMLSGIGVGAEAVTIQLLETGFPKGWQGMRSATAEEAANAKRLLGQWKDGGVLFLGPATLADRRAYRMTKHPIATTPGTPTAPAPFPRPKVAPIPSAAAPAPVSTQPGPVPGTTVTTMSDGSRVTTIPEITITPGADAGPVITTVRRGEGLANVAQRLGWPATAKSATAIQQANLPGPDGVYTAQPLAKGGLKKKGRSGGLQPGDRLFVPPSWAVDPGAL